MGFLRDIKPLELLIILAIVLLLFGAAKIPDIARSLGSSMREFKKGMGSSEDKAAPKAQIPEAPAKENPDSARLSP